MMRAGFVAHHAEDFGLAIGAGLDNRLHGAADIRRHQTVQRRAFALDIAEEPAGFELLADADRRSERELPIPFADGAGGIKMHRGIGQGS